MTPPAAVPEPTDHERRLLDIGRRSCRINADWRPTPFYERGRRLADAYWSSIDRHPLTALRRLLRETRDTREWLDAKWGHYERVREIDMILRRDPSYLERLRPM